MNREPIAIVGIGCRFPGGADSPNQLWQLLRDGVDAIGPIPADRLNLTRLYDERPATPGKIMSRWGGYLDKLDEFDADFFGISPREAENLDPQQRLLLEVTWEALADAGIVPVQLSGGTTGVFVGMWTNDFEARLFADVDRLNLYKTTGTGRYAASGRISFYLNLLGPSMTIDTACSSSLVAVHLGCNALWNGETELALAGGANVILEPSITVAYSQAKMMAPDGHCKFGDARADGYVRSEGAAMVALKRLSQAQADGDAIYALIRGSAVTNDGRSGSHLVTPGQAGQEQMLRRAYAAAGVDPHTVQYVEAHGTGTRAGDPTELGALGVVVGAGRPADRPLLVGSIKTNIGHTEGAAGVAGLVKAALALHHGQIPPSLHLRNPNPAIPWQTLGLEVGTRLQPWPATAGPRLAGTTAFGIAGTNAHAVLQEAPPLAAEPTARNGAAGARAQLFVLSAQAPAALVARARSFLPLFQGEDAPPVVDLAFSTGARQAQLSRRLALVVPAGDATQQRDAAYASLAAYAAGIAPEGLVMGQAAEVPPPVAFVFPGQGAQWQGMARSLLRDEPVFAAAIDRCEAAMAPFVDWSLRAQLTAEPSQLEEIDVIQPTLFAIQVALAELWQAWGIAPAAVVGHSMGEVAAAFVAGALSLEDAARIICVRSKLMREIRGKGAMAAVDLSLADAQREIVGLEDRIAVAVSNSPRSTVLSGDPDAIAEVMARLEAREVFCRLVKVDVASHSPQVDPLLDELRAALAPLQPRASALPLYSTVDVAIADGSTLDAAYWARNLRRPVRFADAVQQLIAAGITTFVELSPHPLLLPALEEGLRQAEAEGQALASLRRNEPERATLLAALGALYVAGANPQWPALCEPGARFVRLPAYPWQRERYWAADAATADTDAARAGGHPLLGHALHPADRPESTFWQSSIDLRRTPWLADHQVQGDVLFPATGFVELMLVAAAQAGMTAPALHTLKLEQALPLQSGQPQPLQVAVEPAPDGALRVRIYSADRSEADAEGERAGEAMWQLHAEAIVRSSATPALVYEPPTALQARLAEAPIESHWQAMEARALAYGPAFQPLQRMWRAEGEALGRLGGDVSAQVPLLDACLQLALDTLPESSAGETWLPVAVAEARVLATPEAGAALWGYATYSGRQGSRALCDAALLDDAGKPLAILRGVEFQPLAQADAPAPAELFYALQWEEADLAVEPLPTGRGAWLVLAAPGDGAGIAAALQARGERTLLVAPRGPDAAAGNGHAPPDQTLDPADGEAMRALVRSLAGATDALLRGVVYAWGMAAGATLDVGAKLAAAETLGGVGLLHLVQALDAESGEEPPRLYVLTRGAQAVENHADGAALNPAQALLWGMGRVAAAEHPALRCTLIDLAPSAAPADAAEQGALAAELWAGARENQVGLRGGRRLVARLVQQPAPAASGMQALRTAPAGTPWRLTPTTPGLLDSLRPRQVARRAPGPGEVEIEVAAAGLNFLDVMKALGIYPGLPPSPENAVGAECAGTVVAVGAGVTTLQVGDAVVAITSSYEQSSCMAAYVTLPAPFVAARPPSLSAAEAAGAPVVFVTALYALHELGHLRRGETVLIHAAAGGVGLAALQLCRRAGAQVIATAGSPAKRDALRALGVEHVFDSRTLDFVDEVRAATGGRGVDLVLNSLAGEALERSIDLLAPRGRFLEIGKRDIYANRRVGLEPFRRNLAFHAIDLARLTLEDPAYVAGLFQQVVALLASGELQPLPTAVVGVEQASEAFHTMAAAGHIGKLVLAVEERPVTVEAPNAGRPRADSAYLITGGLGALGLEVARRLVARGARHLALLGRSAPTPAVQAAIAELQAAGAQLLPLQADVADPAQLAAALDQVRATLPPLRGVFHAAGLLQDAPLSRQTPATLHAALAPKAYGAWNLHQLTQEDPLDFFVLFSSAAALLGLAGQANYAAGNAFLDALAHARRAAGHPALSINWGPWSAIGLAAAQENRGARLAARGLGSITPREGLAALDQLLGADLAQVAVMRFDAAAWTADAGETPLLAQLAAAPAAAPAPARISLRDALLAVEPGRRRRTLLEDAVCAQVAHVLRQAPERIDRRKSLKSMGLDSLMALELRNRLEAETGLTLSATLAWNHPNVVALATHLAARMQVALESAPAAEAAPAPAESALAPAGNGTGKDAAAAPADDDVEALLSDELEAIERLLKFDP